MSKKLLLADDSVTIQKVVNLTFADEGIEVITVGDGETAMWMLSEAAPDLVMADVNMPGISGYDLCEQIKSQQSSKNTPVILLVGSFEPFDEEEARRVGADDFLTKPFQSIRQLVNKVTTLLESAANGQTAGAASNFAETQEFEKPEMANALSYGDTGMDDEMIQSKSTTGFIFDETQKFETRDYEEKTEEDLAITQPLSTEDLSEMQAQPQAYSAAAASVQAYEAKEGTSASSKSALPELDEDDFLELPPLFEEEEEESAPEPVEEKSAPSPTAETAFETPTAGDGPTAQTVEAPQTIETTQAAMQFPPEVIDAIARRVVEKLSESAVKEIAWEVVPQQADLIIRKMVEEKLKE